MEGHDRDRPRQPAPAATGKRIAYFDVLRTVACLSVVLIHASAPHVYADFSSLDFWMGNICDSVAHVAVPLFVMISGALMLDERHEFNGDKLARHLRGLARFFLFWSVVYCLYDEVAMKLAAGTVPSAFDILRALVIGPYHLWFVYLIFGLYLIVPLLRLWVRRANRAGVRYFLGLSFAFFVVAPQVTTIGKLFLPEFVIVRDAVDALRLSYLGGYTFYFVAGWYLRNYSVRRTRALYAAGATGLLVTVFLTYGLSVVRGELVGHAYGHMTVNVLLQTFSVFVLAKEHTSRLPGQVLRLTRFVASKSLGIYAIHAMVNAMLYDCLRALGLTGAPVCIPISFAGALLVSLCVTCLFARIPFLRDLV